VIASSEISKIRTLLLAGGLGSRLSEETINRPKPMVTIGGEPMLKHIMDIYNAQGAVEFIIAIGYKGELIKEWVHQLKVPYQVACLDTGQETLTGGRIQQFFASHSDDRIFMTYGDGLANVDLSALINLHNGGRHLATVTAVRPPARFGVLEIENDRVSRFGEKVQTDAGWINGGFFVLEREILEFFNSEDEPFEKGPLVRLSQHGRLGAYKHFGFWKPMDTLREREELEILALDNPPPWRTI
jgi:glucose-1-phosphate cytidylyltransferase